MSNLDAISAISAFCTKLVHFTFLFNLFSSCCKSMSCILNHDEKYVNIFIPFNFFRAEIELNLCEVFMVIKASHKTN